MSNYSFKSQAQKLGTSLHNLNLLVDFCFVILRVSFLNCIQVKSLCQVSGLIFLETFWQPGLNFFNFILKISGLLPPAAAPTLCYTRQICK